jgi:hypothetical protein
MTKRKAATMTTDPRTIIDTEALIGRIAVLEAVVVNLTQTQATQDILDSGFRRISSRLKTVSESLKHLAGQAGPLRHLDRGRPHLLPEQQAVMDNLFKALLPPPPSYGSSHPCDDRDRDGNQQRSAS